MRSHAIDFATMVVFPEHERNHRSLPHSFLSPMPVGSSA